MQNPAAAARGAAAPAAPSGAPTEAGQASYGSGECLYSQPPARSLRQRGISKGCGWHEYGVYDVAIALTEVPLTPFELEYRERTFFSPQHPPPIQIPTRPAPLVLRVKPKPKACAPPHPSTVRVCHDPEALQCSNSQKKQPDSPKRNSEKRQSAPGREVAREEAMADAAGKDLKKKEKTTDKPEKMTDRSEKTDKTDKSEKSEKTDIKKTEKGDKNNIKEKYEKKKSLKDRNEDVWGGPQEEA